MNKHTGAALAALLGMTASTGSFAQSSVTLYGLLDTGIEYVNHANAHGDSVVRMPGITGSLPSRWGMRGKEDLGGGLATVFVLESGFNVRGGDMGQGGRLFGRQAWVGLQGPFGTLSFGRQYTMAFWAVQDSDLLGPDIYGGVGSFDSYIPNGRSDNTVAWKGTWQGVTAGATWSFGRDSAGTGNSPGQGTCAGSLPGDARACRQWSAMLRYDAPAGFGVVASYDQQRGGPGAAANLFDGVAPLALTSSADTDSRIQANGYAQLGPVKIGGGWLGRHVETELPTVPDVTSNLYYLSASWLATPALTVDGGVYRMINRVQDARGTLVALRTTYQFSKRTSVYAQGGWLSNSAHAAYTLSQGGAGTTPGAGMSQLGLMLGLQQRF
ncbi:porin [Paraburkholderia caballeronis]|uniref:Outer membrane protein (Porin) n=1 Tax=Paraburkholderia caballeronis TaxID=416943 RepID=A0A1H7LG72_9BURK|nr:porin [Paraburkholderia caballeronis]PXW28434.1 putative porin [Paraburkholderia caballeronis]PXX03800.1 putative porin [Paraburkholderia caballeronis]RAK04544.1 putative porin [Paraburkholderia caballeronis]TDV19453.1 putative porin [Paraburkholderia caballeronis]TDV22053.1 putative porin [Paraburkholderia caballeronis]